MTKLEDEEFWKEAARNDGKHGNGENIPEGKMWQEFAKILFIPGYVFYSGFKVANLRKELGIYTSDDADSAKATIALKGLVLTALQLGFYFEEGRRIYHFIQTLHL